MRPVAAEFLGTFALVFFGCGAIANGLPEAAVALAFGLVIAWEAVLTFFLMLVITAVATDIRAVGQSAALAIGGTVALGALVGGPISGASMNPARSIGPALVSGDLANLWIYIAAPTFGAVAGAVIYASLRQGPSAPANGADASDPNQPNPAPQLQ